MTRPCITPRATLYEVRDQSGQIIGQTWSLVPLACATVFEDGRGGRRIGDWYEKESLAENAVGTCRLPWWIVSASIVEAPALCVDYLPSGLQRGRPSALTDEVLAEVQAIMDGGKTATDAARLLGIAPSTLLSALRRRRLAQVKSRTITNAE